MSQTGNILLAEIQRKKRRRMIVIYTLALLGAGVIFTLLGFVNKKQHDVKCWKVEVRLDGEPGEQLLSEKEILSMANAVTDSIQGVRVDEIPIQKIHDKIAAHHSVKEAHVYTTVDGKCILNILLRKPIARIFNAYGESYYLDQQGFTFYTSEHYTPKVPVFIGEIEDKVFDLSILDAKMTKTQLSISMLDDIYSFVRFAEGNDFLSAQIEHVHINAQKEFEIIPRVGNHKINMGDTNDLVGKFKKLMVFYANTIENRDLNIYSSIDLRYAGQVVCVRRY